MCLTLNEFINLSEIEQRKAISEYGKILINYLQGDNIVNIYEVNSVFVKVKITNNKEEFIEVYSDLSSLKLFESKDSPN